MNKIKSFSNFIVEKSSAEMMDYVMDISNKPETAESGIVVDTSKNPLWNTISSELSKVGNPKKLTWKDYSTEVGNASLNWGTHAGKNNQKGVGKIGVSVDSASQLLMITFDDVKLFDSIMKSLTPYNFKKLDHSGPNGKLIFASYEGFTKAEPVILAVKNVLGSNGLD